METPTLLRDLQIRFIMPLFIYLCLLLVLLTLNIVAWTSTLAPSVGLGTRLINFLIFAHLIRVAIRGKTSKNS